jgi:photosystem II stability/assembly factor-like uncharacterized protein
MNVRTRRSASACLLLGALVVALFAAPVRAVDPGSKGGPKEFQELKYRAIGPAAGGRTCRSAGVPGNPLIYYTATASGGVWKTIDGGVTWKPIFDDQTVSSAGSLAIAPSEPNTIYVGTGEANIRGNVATGDGIYKSVDAGKTWKHVWKQEGQIGQMIVHPANPDIAFAAVLGRAFGPNPDRGVYRTTDGGKSWHQVLANGPDTGASDVCFDLSNPRILFAGLWQTRRKPWELTSGGPGSGLYRSDDGGDTWKRLGGSGVADDKLQGLPAGIYGKVGVAVAPSEGQRVYALIEAEKGGLYRSDDGGDNWKLINPGRYLRQRAWYYSTLTVHPTNPDVVWCPNVRLLRSIDGGKTFRMVKGTHHGDHHDVWIDPKDPKRIIDSNDGGVDISTTGGEHWFAPPLPIAQFYHVAADNRTPYHVSGAMQDIGTGSGPSNSLSTGGISLCDWYSIGGGEAGFTVPDPSDPNIVYAGEYGGYISRFDFRTRQARNVSIYPTNPSGHGAEELRYRFQWTAPIFVSPHDPKVVYHAANVLFRTEDAGQTWKAISPDLTRNDKSKQKWSGGPITGDNTGVEIYDTIFALAESPKEKGLLWAGSDDGLVHISRDAGKNWSNVTRNIPGLPEWGTVSCIEPSPFDNGTAYVVVDAHRLDNTRPYLWKTANFGQTWISLAAKLPQDIYLHVIREDPKRKGLLYAGSERGVVISADDGATWQQLKLNLPTVGVTDLIVKDNDLVVGTNGRSLWIFDDLTPIRALTAQVMAQDAHLFEPLPAIRWRYHAPIYSAGGKHVGDNPPRGAIVNYYLKTKPKGPITLEVLDSRGFPVITLDSKEAADEVPDDDPDAPFEESKKTVLPIKPGVNRVAWDLRYKGATLIKGAKFDGGDPEHGPVVPPGVYTLKLTVDGKALTTTVTVLPDPRAKVAEGGLEAQVTFALTVRNDISRLTGMVERLRSVRKQLTARDDLLKDNARAAPLVKQSKELIAKLDALEAKLHNPRAEVSYDILAQKGGAQLYSKLISLMDWLNDSDGPVTQGVKEVYAEAAGELKRHEADLKKLFEDDLTKLNDAAKKLDIPGVIVPAPAKGP